MLEFSPRLLWTNEYPPGSPTHQQVPYAFKVHAFYEAMSRGYDRAIWLDSSTWLLKPLPWAQLGTKGYLLGEEHGWTVGHWCSPEARALLEATDEDLAAPLMEGKIIGLDFTNDKALAFLALWRHAAEIGAFNGSWSNHRHDITCGGVIAHRLGMDLTANTVTPAPHDHSDAYLMHQGL